MKIVKYIILVTAVTCQMLFAEQSVYTNSDFVDTGSMAKKNSTEILVLRQQISQLKEKVEGLNTIIGGLNSEISTLKQKNSNNLEDIINQLSQRVAALESRPQSVAVVQKSAVSKESTSASVSTQQIPKEKSKIKEKSKKSFSGVPSKGLFKNSVLNFTKKRYTKAGEGFKELLKRGYKKASVSYYLGEIAYKRGRYKEAISKYQQSATANENANYMDRLLLHTASSLKKIGKGTEAKVFFKAVVDGYPGSKSAKEAKRCLK